MRKLLIFLPLIVFAGMFFLFGEMLTRDRNPSEIKSVLIGKPAPTFTLTTLDASKTVSSAVISTDTAVVVNFFASWCIPCRAEHDQLTKLANMGIPVIGIAYKDKRVDSQAFLNELGNPFSTALSDLDGRVGIDWGVYGVPETFIVNSEGIITYKHFGPLLGDRFDEFVAAYREANK